MDEILSQAEIDRLVLARQKSKEPAGPESEPGVENLAREGARRIERFDFRAPRQLTRDQIRLLRKVYEDFARKWRNVISVRLRFDVSLNLTGLQLISQYEYMRSLPNPTIVSTLQLSAASLPEKVVATCFCQMSVELALVAYIRLCGGRPQEGREAREPTELERRVLQRQFFTPMVEALREAWRGIVPLDVRPAGLETNPFFLSTGSDQELLVVATFEGLFGDYRDGFSLALPYGALVALAPDATRELNRNQGGNPAERVRLRAHLGRTPIRVEAFLGRTHLTVGEMMALSPGDLLLLPVAVGEPAEVVVGGQLLFRAKPGSAGGKLALLITEITRKD